MAAIPSNTVKVPVLIGGLYELAEDQNWEYRCHGNKTYLFGTNEATTTRFSTPEHTAIEDVLLEQSTNRPSSPAHSLTREPSSELFIRDHSPEIEYETGLADREGGNKFEGSTAAKESAVEGIANAKPVDDEKVEPVVGVVELVERQIEQMEPIEKQMDPVEGQVVSVDAMVGAVNEDTEETGADPRPHPKKRPAPAMTAEPGHAAALVMHSPKALASLASKFDLGDLPHWDLGEERPVKRVKLGNKLREYGVQLAMYGARNLYGDEVFAFMRFTGENSGYHVLFLDGNRKQIFKERLRDDVDTYIPSGDLYLHSDPNRKGIASHDGIPCKRWRAKFVSKASRSTAHKFLDECVFNQPPPEG